MNPSEIAAPEPGALIRPDGRIAYERWGVDGPWVVCVPGMGDLRAEYRFLAPELVRAGYRVAVMDLRGSGESTVSFGDYSAASIGGDVVALVSQLETAGQVIVIGTSLGAASAIWAASERPERVAGVVLIGPFVRDVPVSLGTKLLLRFAFLPPWGASAWVRYYASLYPKQLPPDFPEYRAKLRRNLGEGGRMRALRSMLFSSKAECEQRIPRVHAPALVVMGANDPDFPNPAEEAAGVAARLGARAALIDGAGHYPHAEDPEVTGRTIVDFLDSLKGA